MRHPAQGSEWHRDPDPGAAENVLLVPVQALRDLGDGTYAVFVVGADGTAQNEGGRGGPAGRSQRRNQERCNAGRCGDHRHGPDEVEPSGSQVMRKVRNDGKRSHY